MIRQLAAASAFVLAFAAGPAIAQHPTEAQIDAIKKNCRSDFMSKCRGVKTGGTEAVQCLRDNKASLSGSCAAAISAISPAPAPAAPPPAAAAKPAPSPAAPPPAAAAAPAAPAAAATPAESKPAAAPAAPPPPSKPATAAAPAAPAPAPAKPAAAKPAAPAKPAIAAAPPPSAPAPAAAPAAPPRALTLKDIAALRRTCMPDIGLHCKGVRPGDHRIVDCLEKQGDALLPACKEAVAQTRQ